MRQRSTPITCLWIWPLVAGLVATMGISNALTAAEVLSETQSVSDSVEACDAGCCVQSVTVKNCVGTETICIAPQDEIWVVSADQSCQGSCATTTFETEHLVCSKWQPEDLSDLATCHQQDPGHITVIVVHGNNTDHDWALTRGMQFYDRMFGNVRCDRPAVRLVILAWDSEKVLPRPGPDYKLKSARAVALGTGVGSLINELGGSRPVLVGYSLGVQVVLSTMAELASCKDLDSSCHQHGFHVAMIAPALEADFACNRLAAIPGNPLIEDAEIFTNRNDRVLLAARLLNRKRCEGSLVEPSLVGLADHCRLDCRFRLNDVTREVRNRHSLVNYIQSKTVQCRIRGLVDRAASQYGDQMVEIAGEVVAPDSEIEVAGADLDVEQSALSD